MELSDSLHIPPKKGTLDNKTILRFSHATSMGGGVEAHIDHLNKILLSRNAVKIIYLYMPNQYSETISSQIGRGQLIKIPLTANAAPKAARQSALRGFLNRHSTLPYLVFTRQLYKKMKFLVQYVQSASGKPVFMPQFRDAVHFSSVITRIFQDFHIDIVINHFPGGKDSLQLMHAAKKRNIPVLVINHFNNSWFNHIPIRQQVSFAHGAAGVSGMDVPRYLSNKFVNISNGIDTDFFDPDIEEPFAKTQLPMLLLPARIVREKGHMDLLKAVLWLKLNGLRSSVVFAGRIDLPDFKRELDLFIDAHQLKTDVSFAGDIKPSQLRKLYKSSSLVILPSYFEGIPRVVIEAQAMRTPPISYNSGGTCEALIPDKTGILVKRGDKVELREKIAELLCDEKKRNEMGLKGREFVKEKFSLEAMANRHEVIYNAIIKGRMS